MEYTGTDKNRYSAVIIAYLVSWSPDIVYADVLINPDHAGINYSGRYDFSHSSNSTEFYRSGSIVGAAGCMTCRYYSRTGAEGCFIAL